MVPGPRGASLDGRFHGIDLMDVAFFASQISKVILLATIAYIGGILVRDFSVRVNYTRKANHFALYCIPQVLDSAFKVTPCIAAGIVNVIATVAIFILFWQPVRTRFAFAQTMFSSYDRPEDRPHTLSWLVTQFLATLPVLIAMLLYFRHFGFAPLALMIVLIATVGDGLAEPVGIRYGKRKYTVPSFLADRQYTRSYAGSLCMFAVSAAGVLLFHDAFTPLQFAAALILIPCSVTLVEALSPHTWDNPFLFFSGGISVAVVKQLIV